MSTGGPLRGTEITVRCSLCDAVATTHCKRCNRPACADHTPPRGKRCGECEQVREERLAAIEPISVGPSVKGALQLVGATAFGSAMTFGTLALIVTGLVAISGSMPVLQALLYSSAMAIVFGIMGAVVMGVLALPFVGAAGVFSGTGRAKRRLESWRFSRERPGQRLLAGPALDPPASSEEE